YEDDGSLDAAAWGQWSTAERLRFMQALPRELSDPQLAALDQALGLTGNGNNEVLFLWLELALENGYQPVLPRVEQFLGHVGRNKFIQPLFQALVEEGPWGREQARRIYAKTRGTYHSFTRGNVDALVPQAAGTS